MKYGFTNAFSQLRDPQNVYTFMSPQGALAILNVSILYFDTLMQFFVEKSFVNTVQFCGCYF